jgi:hypothetical protein
MATGCHAMAPSMKAAIDERESEQKLLACIFIKGDSLGSLPPGFPATEIDGEYYWDGVVVSNTTSQ